MSAEQKSKFAKQAKQRKNSQKQGAGSAQQYNNYFSQVQETRDIIITMHDAISELIGRKD